MTHNGEEIQLSQLQAKQNHITVHRQIFADRYKRKKVTAEKSQNTDDLHQTVTA